jgi:hypothetical protein
MSEFKLILCLDFDGVLHSYTSGWKGADVIPDPPVPGAIAFLREAVKHFRVAIFSSRSHQSGGGYAMRKWLGDHIIADEPDIFMQDPPWFAAIEWPLEKPAAMVTIDDRAITFDGTWPAIEALKAFKPWNKKS